MASAMIRARYLFIAISPHKNDTFSISQQLYFVIQKQPAIVKKMKKPQAQTLSPLFHPCFFVHPAAIHAIIRKILSTFSKEADYVLLRRHEHL